MGEQRLVRYGPLRHHRARIASSVATYSRFADGPLAMLRSEPVLHAMSAAPDSQATSALITLLRSTSNRLQAAFTHAGSPPYAPYSLQAACSAASRASSPS